MLVLLAYRTKLMADDNNKVLRDIRFLLAFLVGAITVAILIHAGAL